MSDTSYTTFSRKLLLGIGLVDCCFLALLATFLFNGRLHIQDDMRSTGHNLAQLLERCIADQARLVDDAVVRVQHAVHGQLAAGGLDSDRLTRVLAAEESQLPEINAIRITNATGEVIAGKNVVAGINSSYADRPFFVRHRQLSHDELIVSEPIKGRISGLWVVAFTRSYRTATGQFAGMISAAVPVATFAKLLALPDLGATDTVVLRYTNMGLITRIPPLDGPAGEPGNAKVSAEYTDAVQSGVPEAIFHTRHTPDEVERTYTLRRVGSLPFLLAVGLVDSQYLAPWIKQVWWCGFIALFFLAGSALFAWRAVRHLRERELMAQARAEDLTRRRLLLEESRDGIVIIDQKGKVWEANLKFAAMLGYSLDEVRQLSVWEWDAVWTQEQILGMIAQVDSRGDFFETRHRRKDGTIIDVEISSNGAVFAGDKMIFCVCRDVTERNRARQALKESEEKYRIIFNNEIFAICIFDIASLRLLDVNDAYLRLYGYSREELLGGMTIHDITVEHALSDQATQQATLEGTVFIPLRYHKKKDGTVFPVEIVGGPYEWRGQMVMFGLAHDISDRLAAEEALRKSKERYDLALRATQDAVWDWELTSDTLHYSRRWWEMIGYTPDELPGDSGLWRRVMHPEDLDRATKAVDQALAQEASLEIETRLRHKDGHYVPVLTRGFILRGENGQAIRISGTNTDLTERKKMEKERQQWQRQAYQLEKAESLSRMAGAIAHQFNNLLGATLGNIEIAAEDLPPGAAAAGYLDAAANAATRAVKVSRLMLTYLGYTESAIERLDLAAICRESLPVLRQLVGNGVTLQASIPSTPLPVLGSAHQIHQILENLVTNANESLHDSQGAIFLEIGKVPADAIPAQECYPVNWQAQKQVYACVEVRDNGSGIARKDIDMLFDPFYTSKFPGRGLGLAVVMGILRAHGGCVTVNSALSRGSIFRIYVPLIAEEEQA